MIFNKTSFHTIKSKIKNFHRNRKIKPLDIVMFLRQLAELITAGIPVWSCCDIIEKSQDKKDMRLMLYSIKRNIFRGEFLNQSLRQFPNHFSLLICEFIHIGEQTGKLEIILNSIAKEQEAFFNFKKRIKQALFYPCCIVIITLFMTFFLFIFVIPHFADLFNTQEKSLPWITSVIFSLAYFLNRYFSLFFLSLFIFCGFLFFTKSRALILNFFLKLFLFLPFYQHYVLALNLIRFIKNLNLALTSGLAITDALHLIAHSLANPKFTKIIMKLRSNIAAGLPLHYAMQQAYIFPNLMIQMIRIGEESGRLDYMLKKIGEFLEADIERRLILLNQLLEPLLMIILGVLIGVLLLGMYLPLFKLGTTL